MLFVIIVSHGHDKLLENMLPLITVEHHESIKVIVKDNIKSTRLMEICNASGVDYIYSKVPVGFGENNNSAVAYAVDRFVLNHDDYVIFLNPDVIIEFEELIKIESFILKNKPPAFTIDLFKNEGFSVRDGFIRFFPSFTDFFQSLFFKKNNTILDRTHIQEPLDIDWCAGSFIGFSINNFLLLDGFDENYFMYCEDIDLCYRARLKGIKIKYYPQFKAVHYAMHANRKICSKAFRWHLISVARFLFKKYKYKNIEEYSQSMKSIFKGQ